MRSMLRVLLLAATFASQLVLTKPLPLSNEDIQRRWSRGESEAQIHAAETYRDATPAWSVIGREQTDKSSLFAYATDERTMELHKRSKDDAMTPQLLQKMKDFVRNWYKSKGRKVNVTEMEEEHRAKVEAQLKPAGKKLEFRYHFAA